jgi:GDP/UDP-N,N'-diacetylbacillosamine 2-epimerase (hydrolysing)
LLSALDKVSDASIIFTYPNADTNGHVIREMIDDYVKGHNDKSYAFASLGSLRYLSMIKIADVVIGNSSSGIIEAPALGTPTVNVGDRQKGRLRSQSIIDCSNDSVSIYSSIEKSLTQEFRELIEKQSHPYGDGHTAEKILHEIKSADFSGLIHKTFYNIR